MIINKKTHFTIENPERILLMEEHIREELRNAIDDKYYFFVPSEITDNHEKVIYKVGFLKRFYSFLYPEHSNTEIYRVINELWQVFVGVRQMERLCLKYTELFDKEGIEVIFHDFKHPVYNQLFGDFEPYLSAIDLLFNCGNNIDP